MCELVDLPYKLPCEPSKSSHLQYSQPLLLMGLLEKIAAQLKQPDDGILGKFVVSAMTCATTVSNNWTIGLLDIQPADHVLEIGFGAGLAIKRVAGIASKGFVAGVDISETMVRQARKCNATTIQDGRVDLEYGDISASLP